MNTNTHGRTSNGSPKRLKRFYYATPQWLRVLYRPVLAIRELLDLMHVPVWHLEGMMAKGQTSFSLVVAGLDVNKNYWKQWVFAGEAREVWLGKTWLWCVPTMARCRVPNCDMIIIESSQKLQPLMRSVRGFRLPCWLEGIIDVQEYENVARKKHTIRDDKRLIKHKKLGYEVTKDPEQFQDFYHNMYLPHVRKAHGESAFIRSRQSMKEEFERNGMMILKEDGRNVAGVVLSERKDRLHLGYFGCRDDCPHDGRYLLGPLFFFGIELGKQRGWPHVGVGASRPFLNDGVIRFKTLRMMRVVGSLDDRCFVLVPTQPGPAMTTFLLNHPFAYWDRDGTLSGIIFLDRAVGFEPEIIRQRCKTLLLQGINQFTLACFDKITTDVHNTVIQLQWNNVRVCDAESLLALHSWKESKLQADENPQTAPTTRR